MKELFLKFQESPLTSKSTLAANFGSTLSSPEAPSQFIFDLLVTDSQLELFADAGADKLVPVSIETSLMSTRLGADDRQRLLSCMPPAIQDAVYQAQETTRLRIVSGTTAIDRVGWEAIDGVGTGGGAVGVTRLVPVSFPPPPVTVALPIKILVVITNPKDERLLNSYVELDAITSAIDRQSYNVQILERATREDALDLIRSFQPTIFHYVGHSGVFRGTGCLVLHDPSKGTTDWIGAAEIAQMLPVSTRVLCLSTCFTQPNYNIRGLSLVANAPQSVELPTTVVNRTDVTEVAVRTFWSTFYRSLAENGGNVEDAFFAAQTNPNFPAQSGPGFSLVLRNGGAQPLRIATNFDPARFAEEVQAQFASRLAAELNEKVKSFGEQAPKTLVDSFSDAQSSFSNIARRAANFPKE